jgi:hypothetical protein
VITEPVNLEQDNPTSRPPNTLMILKPTYATPPSLPFSQMAIDVMITPLLPLSDGDDPSTHAVSAVIHHQKYERKKFYGQSINNEHSFVLCKEMIAALNNNSTVLLHFMVDPHGGIGSLASHFLFGTTSDTSPPPLTF